MLPERTGFRPDIEGLRGVAILLVVAFHAGVTWLMGGYVGVDVFFVLSGFFITGLLAREVAATGDVDLADFYARRARRLVPAFLVVLLATIGAALWLYAPIDAPAIAADGRAVALYSGNLLFAQNAVDYHRAAANPLLHTWSLGVEQQFYLIWPVLFALIGRFYGDGAQDSSNKRLVVFVGAAGAISFVASVVATRTAQQWAFFGMPTRIWEFAVGGLAWLYIEHAGTQSGRGLWLQIDGLVAIGVASVCYHEATPYPGFAALLPAGGTAALLIGGQRSPASAISRVLATPLLRWFGRMSYSWYLWHWPLVGIGVAINWETGVVGRLAWSAAALALAVLTYRFIEEPARRGSLLEAEPHLVTAAAVAASVVVALAAHGAMLIGEHRASSTEQRPFAAARVDGMRHDCWGSLLENATAPCVFGDTRSSTVVVLMGDSHAEHWLPAVDRIGRQRHWKVVAMVKPACPVGDMSELVNPRLKRDYTECAEWRRSMLRRIVAMRPAMTILSSWDHYIEAEGDGASWQVTAASWREGLRRTYRTLSSAGINTVVIRGTPRPGFDVPACLSRWASNAPFKIKACEYDRDQSLSRPAIEAQNDAARGLPHISFVEMNDQFCAATRCPVERDGIIVFRDDGHLTATFSLSAARVLSDRLLGAM